ncbi:WbqC family protein [Runella slithyformis]|uniref:WbqC-like family protein n=1 Tax=Runella slithyformis (strain ATCC 29530 / DSM 19594 / LMG 11500 / NCIMB 11436 / LSU 4) TaxID=761193 RepID=A0A7U4E5C8_RUNSL|nr:WbqC family protein [Runella slithyformis]AEI47999.1 WbqC-like family protein [Runella slithyformis DSM 19594]
MRLAIMQPYFLPYIGYLQLLNGVDKFVLYDDVNYINKGWINRNRILINGREYLFTIPLKDASQNKLINEIYLSSDLKWRGKLLKTLEQAYKKAPFYATALAVTEKIVNLDAEKLSDWIADSFRVLVDYLDIQTQIISSSSIYQNTHLKAQERILDICRQEKTEHYINPIGGRELYDKTVFEQNGIQLHFIKSQPIVYPQFKNEFVPWLSIVDIMMFNDVTTITGFLNDYELV